MYHYHDDECERPAENDELLDDESTADACKRCGEPLIGYHLCEAFGPFDDEGDDYE